MPQDWKTLIQRAHDTREVISIARDYLATLTPAEVGSLPRRLRPAKLVDAEDLADYAFEVVRYHTEGDPETNTLSSRLSEFLSGASNRATQLMSTANANANEDDEKKRSA